MEKVNFVNNFVPKPFTNHDYQLFRDCTEYIENRKLTEAQNLFKNYSEQHTKNYYDVIFNVDDSKNWLFRAFIHEDKLQVEMNGMTFLSDNKNDFKCISEKSPWSGSFDFPVRVESIVFNDNITCISP